MSASRGPIRVAVAGARGRMGSLVVQGVVQSRDLQLVAAFDVVNIGGPAGGVAIAPPAALEMALRRTGAQVLIDFTRAEAAVSNVRGAVRAGVSPVVGTTGFSEAQRGRIGRLVGRRVAAVVSPNFSVGVNLLWRLEEMVLG
ncbi:MAG: 4-hydroxy-tetrahydrodipicolinate reductase, partial [Euryarchaeota archaeon]|nr:4-hydroxy-tetrahydrodipicolinate reductase [Euryarchaeota archaeon]